MRCHTAPLLKIFWGFQEQNIDFAITVFGGGYYLVSIDHSISHYNNTLFFVILSLLTVLIFQKHQADIKDLVTQGDLGHGTCGQVVKMMHKPTGHLMAVKVNTSWV